MNLSKLTEGVVSIAKEVGNFIRNESHNFDHDKVEYKGLHDMVSYVDKSAEIALVDSLRSLLPEAGFVTEEKTATISGEKYNWITLWMERQTSFMGFRLTQLVLPSNLMMNSYWVWFMKSIGMNAFQHGKMVEPM